MHKCIKIWIFRGNVIICAYMLTKENQDDYSVSSDDSLNLTFRYCEIYMYILRVVPTPS